MRLCIMCKMARVGEIVVVCAKGTSSHVEVGIILSRLVFTQMRRRQSEVIDL